MSFPVPVGLKSLVALHAEELFGEIIWFSSISCIHVLRSILHALIRHYLLFMMFFLLIGRSVVVVVERIVAMFLQEMPPQKLFVEHNYATC